MSHKTEVEVVVDSREALEAALSEMGFEVVSEKTTLNSRYGFTIDADISIKKDGKELMIGFKQSDDGTFKLEADFFGTGLNSAKFQKDINVLHAKHKVSKWFSQNRYVTTYEVDEEGDIVVVGTKW